MTTSPLQEAELAVEMMPVELLRPAEDNPRDTLGELAELTDSIEANGVIQPLIVMPTGEMGADDAEIMLVVAGHRRLAAAQLAERSHVPVIVRNDIDEAGRQAAMFVENFHRLDLGPIERARALKQLADAGVSQKDIGAKVGVTQPTVSKWLQLLKLPENAQGWIAEGQLTQEDGVAMAALPADTVKELCTGRAPTHLDISHARRVADAAKKVAAAEKDAKSKGWTVLDEDPDFYQQLGLEGDDRPVALDEDRHGPEGLLAHVDPAEHLDEPCHAVYINDHGVVVPACTDPERHPKPEGWKSPFEIEQEELRLERARGPESRGKVPAPSAAERDEIHARLVAAMEPIKTVCTKLLADGGAGGQEVIDFGVLAMLADDDWDSRPIGDLLGIAVAPYNTDGLVDAIKGAGAITGLRVLHAWGMAYGLAALEDLAHVVLRGHDIDDEEELVERARTLLEHLAGLAEVPTFDEFLASLSTAPDADGDSDRPTVEVYEEKGKYKRRCSACGELDGVNTKEDLAQTRAVQHMREVHEIEPAEAGAA